uniref:Proline-rich transmembrane protein 2 n=1 Tax=Neogobius melanostomus TaxID=47308 RepID=A0A8C6UQQ0_9GOBI
MPSSAIWPGEDQPSILDQDPAPLSSQAPVSVPCPPVIGEQIVNGSSPINTRLPHSTSKGELVIVINEKLKSGEFDFITVAGTGTGEVTLQLFQSDSTRTVGLQGEMLCVYIVLFLTACPFSIGNGIHPSDGTSPVISSPPKRQHSISYPHQGKTRKGSRASSIGYTAFSPRPSLSRHSSIATNPPLDRTKVKDYLLLSVLACFCPVWPINIVGFVYSIMVSIVHSPGARNLDGAVRLGRVAKMLAMVSLVGGTVIIIACIVNLASECPKSDL